jgi:integrase
MLSQTRAPEGSRDSSKSISGYSLRAGFVTSAIEANIDAQAIAEHLGWANTSLAIRYTRRVDGLDRTLVTQLLNQPTVYAKEEY